MVNTLFAFTQIDEAKLALTRLYGPGYKVPEEVEIIRQNLKRRIEASGRYSRDCSFFALRLQK